MRDRMTKMRRIANFIVDAAIAEGTSAAEMAESLQLKVAESATKVIDRGEPWYNVMQLGY
jgi:hypothetical protein